MEIFNVNNQASRVQRKARDEAEQRAEKARNADRTRAQRGYLDEAELDAEVREVEDAEATRPTPANEQEAAREDRQQAGYFDHSQLEQGKRLDIEG